MGLGILTSRIKGREDLRLTSPARRLWKGADVVAKLTLEERFWAKVRVAGPDECWLWTAAKFRKDYGIFVPVRGHTTGAHRMSWILANGPIDPPDLCVLHKCDNPPCVNPAHLFLGTRKDNSDDMMAKRRHWSHTGGCSFKGELNGRSKLTWIEVREIRRLYADGATQTALAPRFSISRSKISQIVRGKAWIE